MKLQINDRGSWRHIADFSAINESAVRQRAAKLVPVLSERASLRIVDDKGNAKTHCKGPDFDWKEV